MDRQEFYHEIKNSVKTGDVSRRDGLLLLKTFEKYHKLFNSFENEWFRESIDKSRNAPPQYGNTEIDDFREKGIVVSFFDSVGNISANTDIASVFTLNIVRDETELTRYILSAIDQIEAYINVLEIGTSQDIRITLLTQDILTNFVAFNILSNSSLNSYSDVRIVCHNNFRKFQVIPELFSEDRYVIYKDGVRYVHRLDGESARSEKPDNTKRIITKGGGMNSISILNRIKRQAAIVVGIPEESIDPDVAYSDMGFTSSHLTEFSQALSEEFGMETSPVTLFDYHTLRLLAAHIEKTISSSDLPDNTKEQTPINIDDKSDKAFKSEVSDRNNLPDGGVAIVGISGQFPGAENIGKFWQCLADGDSQVGGSQRWDIDKLKNRFSLSNDTAKNFKGGFIDGVDYFDCSFFGISPKEAEQMDPQQRLTLTHTWKAIEDSGHSPDELKGTDTSVYIGVCDSGYESVLNDSDVEVEAFAATGLSKSVIANRVSYFFDFNGNSQPVDAGCASALVAIKHACNSILCGDSSTAIAGGVNVILSPETHISLGKAGLLSQSGKCHSFSSNADGFVRGEGIGIVLLKNIKDAIRDNDNIYGVIRAVEVNHNGNGNSLTSPNSNAQSKVIRDAYLKANVDPDTVGVVEAHATGTELGDAIEFASLKKAFHGNKKRCALSTLKPIFGHMEIASGMGSLFKAILQIKHQKLLKMAVDGDLNSDIDINESPFYFQSETQDWPKYTNNDGREVPRRAAINAFGFSGINSHLLLEEYIENDSPNDVTSSVHTPELIVLSARSKPQLRRSVNYLQHHLVDMRNSNVSIELKDVAYTLQCGRKSMPFRFAIVTNSIDDLIIRLDNISTEFSEGDVCFFGEKSKENPLAVLAEQKEFSHLISRWFEERNFEQIASLWVGGIDISWRDFWHSGITRGSKKYRRISLPTYPFEKRSIWPIGVKPLSEDIPDSDSTQENPLDIETDNLISRKIKYIWEDVLGVTNIRSEDTFFGIGGHSILVAQVLARIEQDVGVKLSQRVMFEKPTLAQLSDIVEKASGSGYESNCLIEHIGKTNDIPLALEQKAYWFFYELENSSSTYNIPFLTKISGQLDVAALERSINALFKRHEMLRSVFQKTASGVVQHIQAHKDHRLQVVSIHNSELTDMLDNEVQRSFDLENEIPVRIKLFQYDDKQEYILSIIFHHGTMDGWSLGIYIREMAELYRAFTQGKTPSLEALPLTYSDYVIWQNQIFMSASYENKIDFWKNNLAGLSPILDLPTDYIRPPKQSYRGATSKIQLSHKLTDDLRNFARSEGVTLYNVLLSALALLMSKYSRSRDIPIGTAVANRPNSQLEGIVGCFANAIVVRCGIDENISFSELIQKTSKSSMEAFDNAEIPFDAVVNAVKPERSLGVPPIFQVMFRLHNHDMGWDTELQGVEIEGFDYSKPVSELDLNISLRETETDIIGEFTYATDLFSQETIQRFISHYKQLLTSAISDRENPVDTLSMLSADEKKQIEIWNDTETEYNDNECNHHLFEKSVLRYPNKEAYVCGKDRFTYDELNKRANRIANWLTSQGVGPEDRVGLSVGKSSWMGIGTLAILKSGGTFVPLDPFYPEERLGHMLEVAKPSIILTDSACLERVPSSSAYRVVSLDDDSIDWNSCSDENPEEPANAEHSAYILFTSGSTGKPKGILVSHKSWRNMALAHSDRGLSSPDNSILQFASVSFAVSLWGSFMAWAAGGKLVQVVDEESLPGEALYSLLQNENITTVTWPVSLLSVIPIDRIPNCLHTVISSAEPCNDSVVERWTKDSNRRFLNIYGNSEVSMGSSLYEYHSIGQKLTIGTPLPNTKMYLLDESLQLVPPGVVAEIFTGGVGLARGYVDQEEKTSEKFIPNPYSDKPDSRLYRTGDLGRYLPNGEIEFIGREDFQVSVRGFRVELNEVEGVLRENQLLDDLAVVARPDATGVDRLVCFYVLKDKHLSAEHKDLRQLVEKKLPNYMVPSLFVKLDGMPLTPNRKIDRLNLKIPRKRTSTISEIDSQSKTIQKLTSLWKEVLQIDEISINDNFFELGGHSLLATHLTNRIENEFNKKLPVKILFNAPTISELAKVLDGEESFDRQETLHLHNRMCRSPIVLLPGVGGGVLNFYEVANTLNANHEVVALSFNDLYEEGPKSVEDVALQNIEMLKGLVNLNDVTLIGHSFGGWVAYEMLKQMKIQNIRVNALVLVDSLSPVITQEQVISAGLENFVYEAAVGLLGGGHMPLPGERMSGTSDIKHQVRAIFEDENNNLNMPTIDKINSVIDLVYNQLSIPYVPQDISSNCPILAAIAENGFGKEDELLLSSALGWQSLVSKKIHNEIVTGDHFSILHEENAARLSRTVTDWLSLCQTIDRKDVQILRKPSDTEQSGNYETNESKIWDHENPFVSEIDVASTEIDYLGHVSHVVYMSWVGMVTWAHNRALNLDWTLYDEKDSAMAILKHTAEYLLPVTNGEKIRIATWCTECDKRFRLQRKYQVIRERDNKTVFRCTTDYACISIQTGRPKRMPAEFKDAYDKYFSFVPKKEEIDTMASN
ncbi:MAG: amino acid adenylation domain-containing protein [Agarilytica sp.]